MRPTRLLAALLAVAGSAAAVTAQASFPAAFVANEGNLEGSVTSMRIEPSGGVAFVDRVVTGTRSSTSEPCPGCNTYAIDLTPDGRFLATSHAAGDGGENITVYAVAPDGTLAIAHELTVPQGGLDIAWINNETLAVPLTDLSQPNVLRLYSWDGATLTQFAAEPAGTFCTSIAVHPNRRWIYANDSFANTVRVFDFDGSGATLVQTLGIPLFGVALEVTPDGRFLYAAGGISAGGNAFAGYAIDQADGSLSALPGSPYTSPGQSPKGFAVTGDNSTLFVSHGSDATIHSFLLGPDGVPTGTGFSFDVGLQGTLREMTTLGSILYAIDETDILDDLEGVYAFPVAPDGSFAPLPGHPVVTGGISPNDIVVWPAQAGCNPADVASPFDVLDLADVQAFIAGFLSQDPIADLAPPTGVFDLADLQAFVAAFNAGCP
jgi:DNA-binding beta-propeller fold protein YncE